MAKKTKYAATMADGTVLTRSSERPYTHAWAVYYAGERSFIHTGFSSSKDLAEKAARACFPSDAESQYKRAKRNPGLRADLLRYMKEGFGSWEAYREWFAKRVSNFTFEVVPCYPVQ